MADELKLNQRQLKRLKAGVEGWNNWREKNPDAKIDLSGADLREADLSEVDLSAYDPWRANLREADLREAHLRAANLIGANLIEAHLRGADPWRADLSVSRLWGADLRAADLRRANLFEADLRGANLFEANLWEADLSGANLSRANLSGAHLIKADLSGAYLWGADLRGAYLNEADLGGANLSGAYLTGATLENARLGGTNFGTTDLTGALGLEKVKHDYPSFIDTHTLQLFKGHLPVTFLRGCGLSDLDIEYAKLHNPDLTNEDIVKIQYRMFDLRATQALQISPLFISYSHVDSLFVDHIDQALTTKGVRFWRDIHDAKAGRLETQIDRAIRQNQTVLLVLSKNSIKSDWVEHEVRHARKLEKELGRDALCPIALDDSWKSSPWPERVMEQIMEYNILDFSGWQDKSIFDSQFAKLLGGLEIFYKKPAA